MFRELELQLIQQIHLLGKEDYWSRVRMLEESITQCKRIGEEFMNEHKALNYQMNMKGQEVVLDEQKRK